MDRRPYWIAISGPVASGKSTIASFVATNLGFKLLDRGAVFRAVTKSLLDKGINDFSYINEADFRDTIIYQENKLENEAIRVTTFLNYSDVTTALRAQNMGRLTAQAAQNPLVHDFVDSIINPLLFDNSYKGVVMEGREVGTSVMREAELKVFITAPLTVRAERRYHQLVGEGRNITREEIAKNIIVRDTTDFRRTYRPLRRPYPEFLINTDGIRAEEAAEMVCREFLSRVKNREGSWFFSKEY